jgi:plasmid stabilization system protein ParE
LDDLRGIRDYIAADSPDQAAGFLEKLLDSLEALERFPGACPLALENDLVSYELRQLVHGQYRVLYRVVGKSVQILHVRHAVRLSATRDELP